MAVIEPALNKAHCSLSQCSSQLHAGILFLVSKTFGVFKYSVTKKPFLQSGLNMNRSKWIFYIQMSLLIFHCYKKVYFLCKN